MKWLIRIIIAIAVLLLLLPVAGYMLLNLYGVDEIKNKLVASAKTQTGREIEVEAVGIAPSLTPTLSVKNMRIGNPSWAKEKWFADIKEADVNIDLTNLISGQVTVRSINVHNATLAPEISSKGEKSWNFATTSTPREQQAVEELKQSPDATVSKKEISIPLSEVSLENIRILFKDSATAHDIMIESLNAKLADKINLEGKGSYQDFDIAFAFDAPEKSLDAGKGNVIVTLSHKGGDASLKLKGFVEELYEKPHFNGETEISVTDAAALKPWVADPSSIPLPLALNAKLKGTQDSLNISALEADLADAHAAGELRVALAGKSTSVKGSLTLDKLPETESAAADVTPSGDVTADGSKSGSDGKVIPDVKLQLAGLKSVVLDLDLEIGAIKREEGPAITNIQASITTGADRLVISPISLQLGGSVVEGGITSDLSDEPDLSLQLKSSNLPITALISEGAVKDGNITFYVSLDGKGNNLRKWAGNADGKISYDLSGVTIEQESGSFVSQAIALLLGDPSLASKITISCGAGRMNVQDGLITPAVLSADSSPAYFDGKGEVNLAQEAINITIMPYPKKQHLAGLVVPVKIQGSFANPKVSPNKTEAVKAAGSVASKFIKDEKIAGIVGALSKSKNADGPAASADNPCFVPGSTLPVSAPPPAVGETTETPPANEPAPATEPLKPKEQLKEDLKKGLTKGLEGLLKGN